MELFYLNAEQAWRRFRIAFAGVLAKPLTAQAEAATRSMLCPMTTLTPGDFAVVARRLLVLHQFASPERLLELLFDAVRARPSGSRQIGFRAC